MKFKVKQVIRKCKKFPFLRKEWMWTLYAKNGKVIATSGKESYQYKGDCLDTINLIKGSVNRAEVIIVNSDGTTL